MFGFASVQGIQGCSSASPLGAAQTILSHAWNPGRAAEAAKLDPSFSYLRVESGRNVSFVALAYVEPTTGDKQGASKEIYVSGLRETLTLLNGRVVQFTAADRSYTNEFGQTFGATQKGQANAKPSSTTKPPRTILNRVRRANPHSLFWIQQNDHWLAFASETAEAHSWRFTYQCLEVDFCLAIEPWSVAGAPGSRQ